MQTPRFLLALSLSTVTAAVVAGPLAVQALRSDEPSAQETITTTATTEKATVQGVTLTAPPATDEVALSLLTTESSTTAAVAESVASTAPPATRAPTTRPAPATAPTTAPAAAPTTVVTLVEPPETSSSSEIAPGPVAPTITEPASTTVVTVETVAEESTTTVVTEPTDETDETDPTDLTAAPDPTDESKPLDDAEPLDDDVEPTDESSNGSTATTEQLVTTIEQPESAGESTTKPEPRKGEKEDGAAGWIPDIIDIIERAAGEH